MNSRASLGLVWLRLVGRYFPGRDHDFTWLQGRDSTQWKMWFYNQRKRSVSPGKQRVSSVWLQHTGKEAPSSHRYNSRHRASSFWDLGDYLPALGP